MFGTQLLINLLPIHSHQLLEPFYPLQCTFSLHLLYLFPTSTLSEFSFVIKACFWNLQEMNLLVEADQPGNQLDDYITRLNAILSQKAAGILQLQTRLANFQRRLKEHSVLVSSAAYWSYWGPNTEESELTIQQLYWTINAIWLRTAVPLLVMSAIRENHHLLILHEAYFYLFSGDIVEKECKWKRTASYLGKQIHM